MKKIYKTDKTNRGAECMFRVYIAARRPQRKIKKIRACTRVAVAELLRLVGDPKNLSFSACAVS